MRIGAALIVVVFLLTGCAPQLEPTPSSTPETEASVAPTPLPSVAPRAVFDVGCADLVSTATLGALFDPSLTSGQTVALRRDEESAPHGWAEILARQAGAIRCVWGGQTGTDSSYDVGFDFTALPDAADEFVDDLQGATPTATDTVGDRSALSCHYGQCYFTLLADDVWIYGRVSRGAGDAAEDPTLPAQLSDALDELLSGITAAPRRDVWTAPAGALEGWGERCAEGDKILDVLRASSGVSTVNAPAPGLGYPFGDAVASRSRLAGCSVGEDPGVSVDLLVGGGWALDELRSGGVASGYIALEAVDLPDGTPAAVGFEGYFGLVFVEVESSLVMIGTSAFDEPGRDRVADDIVAALSGG